MTSLTEAFLNVHWDRRKPLLLGYSGGPDSKALLYALLECGVKPHIAHVDHGWRLESGKEAKAIEQEATKLGCPCFLHKLDTPDRSEGAAREARFRFFASLFSSDYAALLLAHQAEDLAETVLKRLFEGAHLTQLRGMEPVSPYKGMTLWRPFLSVRKEELLRFLEAKGLEPFWDSSNEDPSYLRARMRQEIFPFLKRSFGKEIVNSLVLLSQRSAELRDHLDQRVSRAKILKGPWGTILEMGELDPLERSYLLQKTARKNGLVLNRNLLETLLRWLKEGQKSKEVEVQTGKIYVDEGRVWLISSDSTNSFSIS